MPRDRLARRYRLSAIGGSFDAVWRPSAHDADGERQTQRMLIAPVPTASGGPDGIDLEAGTATLRL
ncbi:hypothetical protein [Microbacterium sp. gxy059]|uniref:hypothetical protein n=1 Tax=Microbacterium sp. gxy059 TaxID=2957199 RepID=UPI003D95EE08